MFPSIAGAFSRPGTMCAACPPSVGGRLGAQPRKTFLSYSRNVFCDERLYALHNTQHFLTRWSSDGLRSFSYRENVCRFNQAVLSSQTVFCGNTLRAILKHYSFWSLPE